MKKTILIEGMSCGHCSAAVKKALEGIAGVSDVTVDLEGKKATATVADTVSDAAIRDAIDEAGFEVTGIQ